MKRVSFLLSLVPLLSLTPYPLVATDAPPPVLDQMISSGSQQSLRFSPYPGAQSYTFYSATNATGPFTVNTNFALAPYLTGYTFITNNTTSGPVVLTITNFAYEWRLTNFTAPSAFFRVGVTAMNSNTVSAATVLNRLAYGPTPDDLETYGTNAQAYIEQQLNMNGIPETLDNFTLESTNAVPSDPTTNWVYVTVTGTVSQTNLYFFLTAPGDVYLDDVMLVAGTNAGVGPNLLGNGDFESPLAAPWVLVGSVTNGVGGLTTTTSSVAHGGGSSLHLVSSIAGTTTTNHLKYVFIPALTNASTVTLSYWYLTSANSSKCRIQFSGSTLVSSPGGLPTPPTWSYVKATGTANAVSRLYMYLTGTGDCYVDDMKLVAGSVAESGVNLLANGDFESTLTGPWTLAARYVTNTAISTTVAHSGAGSLRLVGTSGGSGSTSASVYQNITPPLANGQTYTLSYWYRPATPGNNLKVNLDGAALLSNPDADVPGLYRRLNTLAAGLSDYRAWFCLHAVTSQRQLFEILSQFWENHFVTQQSKTVDFLSNKGYDGTTADLIATDWEAREMIKWRNAMLNPNCTFYDLLKISAESPAMIVYLDTVNSTGNGTSIANENYARELLELFTFGVDNGYDQNDIILLSRAWTGWSVDIVDPPNSNNPFSPLSVTYLPNSNGTSKAVTVGTWALHFNASSHGTNRGAIFGGKTVPARFGPPWAGTPYQLVIPARATGTTNGMQDGYDVITHFANQPFTEEFISVKLCRLFVHDDFPNPNTTDPTSDNYKFYDYTNPNRSAEAELVHQCMLAWENSSPKGNLRAVLATIFNSDLFRSHTAAAQKVKTPLEYVASSVRALRSVSANGAATASTDGYSFATPLSNMGQMLLFDRGAPDGYAEVAAPWISAGTLVERLRYVQAYCMTNGSANRADAGANVCDPVGLLKKKMPSGNWNNAGAVADYFLGLLYPGEGAANLALYRNAAVNFLNTKDDGVTTDNFSGLSNTSITYDNRVRSMVAMLFTLQRFQEQ